MQKKDKISLMIDGLDDERIEKAYRYIKTLLLMEQKKSGKEAAA